MDVSSAAGNLALQTQATATRKVDAESKVEGKRPDGDNDADDKAGAVHQDAATTATSGNIGRNINTFA